MNKCSMLFCTTIERTGVQSESVSGAVWRKSLTRHFSPDAEAKEFERHHLGRERKGGVCSQEKSYI